ncbi:MAG TPA: 16S rRNA (guanine(966)-N(2))-methyltransferase RsmD [Gillisia sp.]|nr:16S rRNA (guanine(966)-N(2))-methyltransferase RsmD [Gillisia sp.]
MRIISGQHRGKKIIAPKKLPVRPTTDMAKEALFNILNNQYHFKDLKVLDLFSGSGNISYEFASRGAGPIISVDENFECIKFIKKTADELEADITPIKSDVFKYLERAPVKSDIVFADPPYNFDEQQFQKIVELVLEKDILNEGGVLIVEHSKHTKLENLPHFKEGRKYGNSVFSFFSLT